MTINITRLSNGLRVVTDNMPGIETISMGMWINSGSRMETVHNNGVAHFLEHMAFKGTTTRSSKDIAQCIEQVGGYVNASTSRELTAYYLRMMHGDHGIGLEILADILLNSTFVEHEMGCERKVILQELGMSLDSPEDLISDYFQQTAFPEQSLGRTILGCADNINALTADHLRQFMRENYFCENMVLAASGRVDHDTILQQAERLFAALPAKQSSVQMEAGLYTGGEKIVHKNLEQLHCMLGFQGIPITDKNYYALSVLVAILGGGMSSRLFQNIREKLGLVYSIYSFKACYRDTGLVSIYAGTGATEVKKLIPAIVDEIKSICNPVFDDELARAKAQLKTGMMMGMESTANRCEYLAQQTLFYNQPIPVSEIAERIEQVTVSQLQDLAQQVFSSSLTVAGIGPIEHLHDAQSISEMIAKG